MYSFKVYLKGKNNHVVQRNNITTNMLHGAMHAGGLFTVLERAVHAG